MVDWLILNFIEDSFKFCSLQIIFTFRIDNKTRFDFNWTWSFNYHFPINQSWKVYGIKLQFMKKVFTWFSFNLIFVMDDRRLALDQSCREIRKLQRSWILMTFLTNMSVIIQVIRAYYCTLHTMLDALLTNLTFWHQIYYLISETSDLAGQMKII